MTEEIRMSVVDMHKSCPVATKLEQLQQQLDSSSVEIHRLWCEHRVLLNKHAAELKLKDDQINGLKKKNAEYVKELKDLTTKLTTARALINSVEGYHKLVDRIKLIVRKELLGERP